jgi:hypothetical protein
VLILFSSLFTVDDEVYVHGITVGENDRRVNCVCSLRQAPFMNGTVDKIKTNLVNTNKGQVCQRFDARM